MLTVAELAAILGITRRGMQMALGRHGIRPEGKRGRAYLYDAREVLRRLGTHDRLA